MQTFPFFGVEATILNEHGEELEGEAEGYLVSSDSTLLIFIYPCKEHSSSFSALLGGERRERKIIRKQTHSKLKDQTSIYQPHGLNNKQAVFHFSVTLFYPFRHEE